MQIESTNRNRNTKISTQILASHLCMCFQNPATNWSKFFVCVTQFWNWLATQFWFWGHTLSLLTYSMSENTFWVWGWILKVRTHCDFEDKFWGQGFQMWKSARAPTLWGRGADAWWDHSGIGAKRSLFGICHPARHLIFFFLFFLFAVLLLQALVRALLTCKWTQLALSCESFIWWRCSERW